MAGRRRVLAALVVSVVMAAACAGGDESEPVTLSLGFPFAADHPLRVQVLDPWAEDVWEATGHTVGVEFHPEQALSPAAETYANVVAGGQDIGWALQGYSPGRFPATAVVEMPFVFGSAAEGTVALWALYEEFEALRGEYSDVKVLGLWTTGPGDLWLVDGAASAVADIAGLTLRSPTPVQAAVIRALGAVPVTVSPPDIRAAIDAGEIDGLLTVDTALAALNLVDVIESGTECRCYVLAGFLVMNLDTWDSLSPDQQAAIDDVSLRTVSAAAAGLYDRAGITAAQENAEAGIVKVRLDDDQLEEWKQATRSVVDDWVDGNSGFDARAMYERMLELAAG
ncbi:TRAP transporter substrate-binding protein [Candidatus Spongiisocius sp.]|uniref:TRAP transporter substrate-binding protein n=1 Tax=Candidatus Spongiisocius sp. TaxID=3101273 RepID=UPI003B5BFFD9